MRLRKIPFAYKRLHFIQFDVWVWYGKSDLNFETKYETKY